MEMTIQPLTEQQKADIKRLAAAMREGAKMRPQTRSVLFNQKWVSSGVKAYYSCALGAAWEGAHPGFNPARWVDESLANHGDIIGLRDVEKYFGLTPKIDCINPQMGWKYEILGTIIDLNDKRDWTREAIADWLDTLAK